MIQYVRGLRFFALITRIISWTLTFLSVFVAVVMLNAFFRVNLANVSVGEFVTFAFSIGAVFMLPLGFWIVSLLLYSLAALGEDVDNIKRQLAVIRKKDTAVVQ